MGKAEFLRLPGRGSVTVRHTAWTTDNYGWKSRGCARDEESKGLNVELKIVA